MRKRIRRSTVLVAVIFLVLAGAERARAFPDQGKWDFSLTKVR